MFEYFDMNRNGVICYDDIVVFFIVIDYISKLVFFNKMVVI